MIDLHRGAEADGHAAVAHLVDEILDDLAVDEIEHPLARLDQRHRHVEGREDGGVFDADDAAADDCQRPRQAFEFEDFVAVEDPGAVEGDEIGAIGLGAGGDQRLVELDLADFAFLGRQLDPAGPEEAGGGVGAADHVAHELVLQHLDLVIERLVQAGDQIEAEMSCLTR